jgi:hypothetical protein
MYRVKEAISRWKNQHNFLQEKAVEATKSLEKWMATGSK